MEFNMLLLLCLYRTIQCSSVPSYGPQMFLVFRTTRAEFLEITKNYPPSIGSYLKLQTEAQKSRLMDDYIIGSS